MTKECTSLAQRLQGGKELQFTGVESLKEIFQKQAAEQTRENPDGQEESGTARDPLRAVGREPAAGDDAMQMRVMEQVRSPTVEHGEEANFGTQMFGIGGDGVQGLGGGAEQNPVDHFLVLVGDAGNLFRYRKDHVEILSLEKLGAAILEPFGAGQRLAFWAVSIGTCNGELSITCVMGSLF